MDKQRGFAPRSSPPCWPLAAFRRPRAGRYAASGRGSRRPPASAHAREGRAGLDGAPPRLGPLYRVILNDGTALVSFGEFTRVGDRVVFSMPLDSPRGERLQLVNLPASAVNWESTEDYTHATRYAQYAASRGEADFAVLTGRSGARAHEIALATDPARKLQIAEQTRRIVTAWPMEHYGYRSTRHERHPVAARRDDLGPARRGRHAHFDFSIVATMEPPSMPLLPDPSPSQSIEQAIVAARLSDVPAERITLLKSALTTIERRRERLPGGWVRQTRASAQKMLDAEIEVERRYAELSKSTVPKATSPAAKADVRGVEQAVDDAAGARPRARGEAARPGGRAAGAPPGAPRRGAPAAPDARPVDAEVGGVPRLQVGGGVADRRARGPAPGGWTTSRRSPAPASTRCPSSPRGSSASTGSSPSSSRLPRWPRRTPRCAPPPTSGSRRCGRASARRSTPTWRRPGTRPPRRPAPS